ncbi:putative NAD-binding rossmann fold oxidoreductase [Rhizoctonia solani 123E]|uniref:Putative NAD-binding rossmann fold oxidoreductase n=1 Tax=Rhizoctonia solani 123E TaxID=1423351 RepID=A0A074SDZ7_9AGAM|nr:putative NAD-binding rossmann fold oxidoreductase [Rhizoctonia solani 123E]
MAPIGLAILGAGIFAKEAHLPALAVHGSEKSVVNAVYSRSKSSASSLAEQVKERLGNTPTVYSEDGASEGGLDALLARPDIQAVIVVLPLTQQPDVVLKALAAGKSVLSEKPVAKDVKTGIDLIEKWEKEYKPKGLIWRVAENFEVEPGILEAAERIKAGAIGKVRFFNCSMIFPMDKDNKYYQTSWRTIPDYQGGFLLDAGVHTNAALRKVLGSSFPLDTAKVTGFASLTRDFLAPHDTFQAVIQAAPTSDGEHPAQGVNEMSCAVKPGFSRYILTVTGTEGTLTLESVPKPVREADLVLARASAFKAEGNEKPVVPHWQTTITGPDGNKTEEFARIGSGVYEELGSFLNALSGKDDGNGEPRYVAPYRIRAYSVVLACRDALLDVALIQAYLTSQGNAIDMKKLVSTGSA